MSDVRLQTSELGLRTSDLLLTDTSTLRGDALPAAVAEHKHIGVAQRQFRRLPLPDADQMEREPDYGAVAIDLYDEVVLNRRFHLLVELGRQRELFRAVTARAIVVGGNEFVGEDLLDGAEVLVIEGFVPGVLELDEDLLLRFHRRLL